MAPMTAPPVKIATFLTTMMLVAWAKVLIRNRIGGGTSHLFAEEVA